MLNLYASRPLVTCFDDAPVAPAAPAAPIAPAAPAAAAAPASPEGKTFSQDELNRILADDRRKHQATLAQTEKTYKELLDSNTTLSAQERKTLEDNLAVVQGQMRTKEEQAKVEKQQLEQHFTAKLSEATKKAEEWETRYRGETAKRALRDAAADNDAFRADQIVSLLKPMTKMVADPKTGEFNIVVEFPDVDSTGEPVVKTFTPDEAVKRMRELPGIYGNLFKANVVSGIGSNSTSAGLPAGANGKVDLKKLAKDPVAFRKAMKENPELLGLRRR